MDTPNLFCGIATCKEKVPKVNQWSPRCCSLLEQSHFVHVRSSWKGGSTSKSILVNNIQFLLHFD